MVKLSLPAPIIAFRGKEGGISKRRLRPLKVGETYMIEPNLQVLRSIWLSYVGLAYAQLKLFTNQLVSYVLVDVLLGTPLEYDVF